MEEYNGRFANPRCYLGLEAAIIKIHREDPLTTHACPGKNVRKMEIVQEVQDLLVLRHTGEHAIKPVP